MAKFISKERAKEICSHWYGGQWTALYSYASTGEYCEKYALKYLKEIEEELQNEFFSVYPRVLTGKEYRELNSLKNYFLKIGLPIVFHPHPVYGYNIPFLVTENKNVDSLHLPI
jgi:hypothetical protein